MIFWLLVGLFVYFMYISPGINVIDAVKHDTNLSACIEAINNAERFDPRSCKMYQEHIKLFLNNYGKTLYYVGDRRHIRKMIYHRHKCIGYLNRIPFRINNDVSLKELLERNSKAIDAILKNYIVEATNRAGIIYVPN